LLFPGHRPTIHGWRARHVCVWPDLQACPEARGNRLSGHFRFFPGVFPGITEVRSATEGTFKGVVQEVKLVPPSGGKPVTYLVMKSGPDVVQVFLCPQKFLDDMGIAFKADDAIEVTGSKVKQDGADLILAREVVKNGDTVTLRFKGGKPAW